MRDLCCVSTAVVALTPRLLPAAVDFRPVCHVAREEPLHGAGKPPEPSRPVVMSMLRDSFLPGGSPACAGSRSPGLGFVTDGGCPVLLCAAA